MKWDHSTFVRQLPSWVYQAWTHTQSPEVLSSDPPRFTLLSPSWVQPQVGLALNSEQLLFLSICVCVCVSVYIPAVKEQEWEKAGLKFVSEISASIPIRWWMDFHLCCTKVWEIVFETFQRRTIFPETMFWLLLITPSPYCNRSSVELPLTEERVLKQSDNFKLKKVNSELCERIQSNGDIFFYGKRFYNVIFQCNLMHW